MTVCCGSAFPIVLKIYYIYFFFKVFPQYENQQQKYSTLEFCVWKPCVLHPTDYASRLPFSLRTARLYAIMSC